MKRINTISKLRFVELNVKRLKTDILLVDSGLNKTGIVDIYANGV